MRRPLAKIVQPRPGEPCVRTIMKYLLHERLGYATIHRIGDRLRLKGSRHHWIEKYHGRIFLNVSDVRDEMISDREFAGLLDPVDEGSPSGS